ncbi:MAG: phytanoyl-CoA dioxygenase family protein [Bdellovibrionales bacterium]
MDYQSFVGMEVQRNDSEWDQYLEYLDRRGYFIIPDVLKSDQLNALRSKMLEVWDEQLNKYGEPLLRQVGDFGVCRSMMEYDDIFSELVLHPIIEKILQLTVGDTAILHLQNGICVFPDEHHNQGRYHKDFPRNFLTDKILSINTFFVIDDFDDQTGGTWLLPCSHRFSDMPSEEYIKENEIQVHAKAGSLMVFDSLLWHRAGVNYTNNVRRGINHQFTKPFIKQQLDYPVIYKDKVDLESRLAQRLGMWTLPPKSVDEYRVSDPAKRTYRAGQG